MRTPRILTVLALLAGAATLRAQEPDEVTRVSFDQAAVNVQRQLAQALADLASLREQIAAEKVPMNRTLGELEAELSAVRAEFQQKTRLLDSRSLDLGNLRAEIKARQDEAAYLGSLLGEYLRNFESRLHIAELQRYQEPLQAAKLAVENTTLQGQQVFAAQAELLAVSLGRLEDALGGSRFEGRAVDQNGLVSQGTFVVVGPAAIFQTSDGKSIGTAEQRLGSLEPSLIPFEKPENRAAAAQVVGTGAGSFPLDPTLGNAHKIESIQETFWEHVLKGGPVMWPIFVLAGLALLVALYKWISLSLVRSPSPAAVKSLLGALARRDLELAKREVEAIRGPTGAMLAAGVEHVGEPRELVEEVMYETVLSTRLRLQRWLPFIAITASSAPLLGLLGTVTGIMNTFTLMTVFGTGDAKTLSSGISEALITTESGLYVAIPSLLLYAFLSRKARRIVDDMEKAAVSFVNQLGKTPYHTARVTEDASFDADLPAAGAVTGGSPNVDQVREILAGLLAPMVHKDLENGARRARTG